jgi:starch phosphorylase
LVAAPGATAAHAPARTGLDARALERGVLDNLVCLQGRPLDIATAHDWYSAVAYSVPDRMLARWAATIQTCAAREAG